MAKLLERFLASFAKAEHCLSGYVIVVWSAAKIGWKSNHTGNLALRVGLIGQLRGGGETTESVSNSEGPKLSDWESAADSKGGNCESHKRV